VISAIIPARGGSKGIPRKNVISLCGKPLIAWSIEQAQQSQLVNRVVVATHDDEIASVARYHGADVYWRSAASASDIAPTEQVIAEWLRTAEPAPATCVLLQATSPIRQPYDVDECLATMIAQDADSCFSARIVHGYTWRRGLGILSATYSQRLPRQQHSLTTLEENGSIYCFKTDVFRETGNRLGGKVAAYLMHPLDSFQVDEMSDLQVLAELMEVRLNVRPAAAS